MKRACFVDFNIDSRRVETLWIVANLLFEGEVSLNHVLLIELFVLRLLIILVGLLVTCGRELPSEVLE